MAESRQSLIPDNAKGLSEETPVVSEARESRTETAVTVAVAPPEKAPEQPVTVIAQNTPPPAPVQRVEETRKSDDTAVSANATRESAANTTPDTLPQTASYLPLIGLVGLISLALAVFVGSVRRQRSL